MAMIGELLTTAFVWGQLSSLVLLSVNTNDNTWHQLDDSQLDAAICQQVLSTEEFTAFNTISGSKASVVEIRLASQAATVADYQPGEDIVRAYSVPITVPETGQLALWGDNKGEFFEIDPGVYQVTAEARYLQKNEVSAYVEAFPKLSVFLEREWNSPELRDDAPELWRLTFIPTDEPTEAVELYRELSLRERRQRGLE